MEHTKNRLTKTWHYVSEYPLSWNDAKWLSDSGYELKLEHKSMPVETYGQTRQVITSTAFVITTKSAVQETLFMLRFSPDDWCLQDSQKYY